MGEGKSGPVKRIYMDQSLLPLDKSLGKSAPQSLLPLDKSLGKSAPQSLFFYAMFGASGKKALGKAVQ